MIATSGFDAVRICLEHRSMAPSVVYGLIQACRLGGADTLIRVKPSTDYHRGPTRSLATGIHMKGISAGSSLGGLSGSMAEWHCWSAVFDVFGLFGRLIGGAWADRWSRTQPRARSLLPALGMFIAAPSVLLVAQSSLLAFAIAGLSLYGLTRSK